jgi:hypothetical protein
MLLERRKLTSRFLLFLDLLEFLGDLVVVFGHLFPSPRRFVTGCFLDIRLLISAFSVPGW